MIYLDLDPFTGLFSSLAALGQLNVEVWDATKPVFSTAAAPQEISVLNEAQAFSQRVQRQATFQHAVFKDQHHAFGIPITNGQKPIGALIACTANSDQCSNSLLFDTGQWAAVRQMESFLSHMAGLIEERCSTRTEIESLASELTKCFEDIYVYSNVANQIKTLKFPGRRQTELAEEIMKAMRMELAFIVMPGREENDVIVSSKEYASNIRELESFVKNLILAISRDASRMAEDYFMVKESLKNQEFSQLHSDAYRFLAVKIQHEGNLYGWLGLVSFKTDEIFRRSELRLLMTMAEQLALVIFGSDLYYDLERLLIHVVKSLVYAIEAKDVYTRGHSERVSHYCMRVAEHLGMSEKEKRVLQLASLLHDIGKIGTPEQILNKPASLDQEEIRRIKEHPRKGYNILKPLEQLSDSLPGILYHHERYDGKGYPSGLKCEEIPFHARLIAVTDTFDALTTDRAYRPARSAREAIAIMDSEAGTRLDPYCVAVFKEVFNNDLKAKDDIHDC